PETIMASADQQQVTIIGDPTRKGPLTLDAEGSHLPRHSIDVVFPVLHGTYGEDGTIQGLLDMAGVPYVVGGVLASAAGMEKIVMKNLFKQAGLEIGEYEWFLRSAWERDAEEILERI